MHFISIVLFLVTLYSFNVSCTEQEGQRPTVDMIGSDLRNIELSERLALLGTKLTERIAEFEKNYIQRVTSLETKLEIYTNELENNKDLEVTAEMMKVVMALQKKIENIETENTEKQQTLNDVKGEINKLNQLVSKHNENIQNVSDYMREQKYELEAKIQQLSQQYNTSASEDNMLFAELNNRINDVQNMNENNTNILTEFINERKSYTSKFSITFSTCGFTRGVRGPTLTACKQSYGDILLQSGESFTVDDGVQKWMVPETGNYVIEAAGAAGGNGNGDTLFGGKGAKIKGTFNLTALTILNIVVGQMGGNGAASEPGGGGGGTFVYEGNMGGPGLLIAAGGGGGSSEENGRRGYDGWKGELSFLAFGPVGVAGSGGHGGNITTAGAGWSGNGRAIAKTKGNPGTRWRGGISTDSGVGSGGFGGGGSGVSSEGGGGGGGYTGGQGLSFLSETNRFMWGGSGGGSFNSGSDQENISGNNNGAGYVKITKLLD